MSAIKPISYPLVQKQEEDQSNFVPIENEEDKMRKHSSVDDSYNDWVDDSPYDDDIWDDWTSSGSDDWGSSSWDSWSGSSWDS